MNKLTVNDLSTELHVEPKVVRKFLRDVTPKDQQPGLGGRWEFSGNKPTLRRLHHQYKIWSTQHGTLISKHSVS